MIRKNSELTAPFTLTVKSFIIQYELHFLIMIIKKVEDKLCLIKIIWYAQPQQMRR